MREQFKKFNKTIEIIKGSISYISAEYLIRSMNSDMLS